MFYIEIILRIKASNHRSIIILHAAYSISGYFCVSEVLKLDKKFSGTVWKWAFGWIIFSWNRPWYLKCDDFTILLAHTYQIIFHLENTFFVEQVRDANHIHKLNTSTGCHCKQRGGQFVFIFYCLVHVFNLVVHTLFLPKTFELYFQPFIFKFHVIQAFDRLFCSSWINVFEETKATVLSWDLWIFLEHKLLKHPKWFAKLPYLGFLHIVWQTTHKQFSVFVLNFSVNVNVDSVLVISKIAVITLKKLRHGIKSSLNKVIPIQNKSFHSEDTHLYFEFRAELFYVVKEKTNVCVLSLSKLKGHDSQCFVPFYCCDWVLLVTFLICSAKYCIEICINLLFSDVKRNILDYK